MAKVKEGVSVKLNGYQKAKIKEFIDVGLFSTISDFITTAIDSKIQELSVQKIELKDQSEEA